MQFEIGKIINYSNNTGEILSVTGEKYIFLEKDLKEDINSLNNSIVIFRPENINNQKRAFYIQKLENSLLNKKERNKILRKIYSINNINK